MQWKLSIRILNNILLLLYVALFLSIACAFRGITSISIGLIVLFGILSYKKQTGRFIDKKLFSPFVLGCFTLFILDTLSLLYTNNLHEDLNHLSLSSALVFVPLALSYSKPSINRGFYIKSMKYFSVFLIISSVYCLCIAFFRIMDGQPISVLFYHSLVKPFDQHAVQYSILIFFDLLFLFEYSRKEPIFTHKRYLI